MRKLMVSKIWISAFLLAVFVAGCGDPDKGAISGNPNNPLTLPIVASVTPPTGSAVVCPNTPVVTATFSKAMNPATINTATFTLADPTGASVAGTVSLDSTGLVATFTPMNALAVKTTFMATITTGAADTFGNTLAANFTWTFTTSPFNPCPPPVGAVTLGVACGYGVLAGATVTNTPTLPATTIKAVTGTADLGLSPGSSITGFAIAPTNTYVGSGFSTGGNGIVTGTIHLTDPPPPAPNTAAAAQTALNAAFLDISGRSTNVIVQPTGELGGLTLAPGLYKAPAGSFAITSLDLTLDAGGDASAIWIFQMPSSTLTVGNARKVILTNGASASNVFWAVGSSATIGTTADVQGNILTGSGSITLQTHATLEGRALAQVPGAVTLDSNTVTIPLPCQ